jgi:hypothetical protein
LYLARTTVASTATTTAIPTFTFATISTSTTRATRLLWWARAILH